MSPNRPLTGAPRERPLTRALHGNCAARERKLDARCSPLSASSFVSGRYASIAPRRAGSACVGSFAARGDADGIIPPLHGIGPPHFAAHGDVDGIIPPLHGVA